jgi:drug/metabolite transporter (DMT)-like permease
MHTVKIKIEEVHVIEGFQRCNRFRLHNLGLSAIYGVRITMQSGMFCEQPIETVDLFSISRCILAVGMVKSAFLKGSGTGVQFMLISVFFFAMMNASAKYLHHIPVHELVFFRSLVVCAVSFYFIKKLHLPVAGNNRKWLLIRGISGLTALLLFFMTLKKLPLASATSLQYLSPIFTVIFAVWLNHQKVRSIQWVYFLIAFVGVLLIKGFDDRVDVSYVLLGVLSSIVSGFAYNSIIRLRNSDHPYTIVIHLTFVSIPVTAIWSFFDFLMPVGWDWFWLLFMGLCTQIAQYYATKALISGKADQVTPWNYIGAVFSLVIGYLVFDESISWLSVAGIALIVFALVLNSRLREVVDISAKK